MDINTIYITTFVLLFSVALSFLFTVINYFKSTRI